jgi:hypothetical protein
MQFFHKILLLITLFMTSGRWYITATKSLKGLCQVQSLLDEERTSFSEQPKMSAPHGKPQKEDAIKNEKDKEQQLSVHPT